MSGARHGRSQPLNGGAEQARLQAIVERMADGVVIVGGDGMIRFANPAAERLFGRSTEELTGRELGFPVVTGDNTEVEVVRPQQQTVTAELRTVDIEWEGQAAHLVSLRDVTDRKRSEERAAQLDRERLARVEAEAANRAKSDFLALMSHELRTPLNAVIGYAELLEMGVGGEPLPPPQQDHVSRITASGRHLLGLVNEILDLAKVEAGQLSLQQGVGRSNELIDAAVTMVQPVAKSRNVTLSVEVQGSDLAFHGDEGRVRQILVNLLSNAIKFTGSGGRVTLTCGRTGRPDQNARLFGPGPWHFFRVADTGIGIPAEKLTEIFDAFVQVEGGHARRQEGSGLGLAISRRLARLMKGDVTVQSEPGRGSTFTLWLTDATVVEGNGARRNDGSADQFARLDGLGEVGTVLLRELPELLEAFVGRLRDELLVEGTSHTRHCELSGHVGAFAADVACSLIAMEEVHGRPSSVLADSAYIQAAIAERHGMERAQLGWSPNLLAREWLILCEEMKRIVRLHGRGIPPAARDEAFAVLDRAAEEAIETSCRALNRESQETPTTSLILPRGETASPAGASDGGAGDRRINPPG